MGVWGVAILDSGVVDEFTAVHGGSLWEQDLYYGDNNTDGGRSGSLGTLVADSIELTNSSLERFDFQISSNSETYYGASATEQSLRQLINLDNAGYNIGAINMSFGTSSSSYLRNSLDEINELTSRGIFSVAASGNSGSDYWRELSVYPARYSNVISVGSHDGDGRPSAFSNNGSTVHILADGRDFPENGIDGTSFAAPQVAAGVATVQALADSGLGYRLSLQQMIDVLQQGGQAPLSSPDPADGTTRYYLYDHQGIVTYFHNTYFHPNTSGWEYFASNRDLMSVFGNDPAAAMNHFMTTGVYEGRTIGFDGLAYVASHADLITGVGINRDVAAHHFIFAGQAEGRGITFDASDYLAANPDVDAAVSGNLDLAAAHYIQSGFAEGRATSAPPVPPIPNVSEGAADLPRNATTTGSVAVGGTVTGTIRGWYDRDWFKTEFVAGQTVEIRLSGTASGGGSLSDPVLRLYDASSRYLAFDDDDGPGRDSYLRYTPTESGTYCIEADGWSLRTGSYTLSVTAEGGGTSLGLHYPGDNESATQKVDDETFVGSDASDVPLGARLFTDGEWSFA